MVTILFNTFCVPLMCALGLPLLLIVKRLTFSPPSSMKDQEEDGDEYMLNEHREVARVKLFKISVTYLGVLMLKVLSFC